MLQFTVDSAPAAQQVDTCQACCCESWSFKPGTINKAAIDYTMWAMQTGRLHCNPYFDLVQQQTCGVPGGSNLPPQPGAKVAFDTAANTALQGDLNSQVTDPDGDQISYKVVPSVYGPKGGKVAIDPTGQFIYTPNPNWIGIDRFYASANDGINAAVVFEVIVGVGSSSASAAPTPHVSVLTDGVQVDGRLNRVTFPVQITPAAQLCEVWKLTVTQQAVDCGYQCYNRTDCFDIRIVKC